MVDLPTVIRIAPAWDTPELREQACAIPSRAADQPAEAFIHRGRNTLVRMEVAGQPIVAKLFPAPKGWKKLTRRGCKATQAFDHATKLVELGIGTPEPLAALRFADGSACYVCAWIPNCRSVWDLHDEAIHDSDRHCHDLGSFVAAMHMAGVLHRDNTPGNILLKPDEDHLDHLVVDTNRMRFGRVGIWRGLGSLVQLECQGRLLDGYCWARGWGGFWSRLIFRIQYWRHRLAWWLKNGTRPWRRKLGF